MKIKIKAADKGEEKLFYACDEEEIKASKIGHMRFDFGTGRQFYGSWFGTISELNDDEFRAEFNEITKELRHGLLKDRTAMGKYIRENPSLDLGSRGNGYKVQTDEHTYYLLCKPQPGDYDCYCFCYERDMLEQAMSENIDMKEAQDESENEDESEEISMEV